MGAGHTNTWPWRLISCTWLSPLVVLNVSRLVVRIGLCLLRTFSDPEGWRLAWLPCGLLPRNCAARCSISLDEQPDPDAQPDPDGFATAEALPYDQALPRAGRSSSSWAGGDFGSEPPGGRKCSQVSGQGTARSTAPGGLSCSASGDWADWCWGHWLMGEEATSLLAWI